MKRKSKLFLFISLCLVFSFSFTYLAEAAVVWSSSAQWATWSEGGYTLYNNIWGQGAGYQEIWANSHSNWGVFAQHPDTGGVKSYPNVSKDIGLSINSIKTLTSSFNVTVPSGGSYTSAYDIWLNRNAYEIMLWMNSYGNVAPIAEGWDSTGKPIPAFTNVSIGGHTWNVYRGGNRTKVYSFVRTSSTNSGTVDILAVLNWLSSQGWFRRTPTLNKVQFGFEITSSSAGYNFTCNSYDVTQN